MAVVFIDTNVNVKIKRDKFTSQCNSFETFTTIRGCVIHIKLLLRLSVHEMCQTMRSDSTDNNEIC